MQDTLNQLNIFGQKNLKYSQFVACCINAENFLKDDKIFVVFKLWDMDRDGILKKHDIEAFMSSEFPTFYNTKFGQSFIAEYPPTSGTQL
jgi:Ca2+-binding EF-hand superfamily protein